MASLEGVDEDKGRASSTPPSTRPLESQLYTISYLSADTPHALTTGHGWWDATVANKGGTFVGTYSDPNTPPRTGLHAADGTFIRWIEENKLDARHPYAPYLADRRTPEYGTLKADDGTLLQYSITTPVGFDPKKKYPAILEVYGGPHVQTVRRDWGAARPAPERSGLRPFPPRQSRLRQPLGRVQDRDRPQARHRRDEATSSRASAS